MECLNELYAELRELYLWGVECDYLTETLIENDRRATCLFNDLVRGANPATA